MFILRKLQKVLISTSHVAGSGSFCAVFMVMDASGTNAEVMAICLGSGLILFGHIPNRKHFHKQEDVRFPIRSNTF